MQLLSLSVPQRGWEPWQTPDADGTCQNSLTGVQKVHREYLRIEAVEAKTLSFINHISLFIYPGWTICPFSFSVTWQLLQRKSKGSLSSPRA